MFPKDHFIYLLGQAAMHFHLWGLDECNGSNIFERIPQPHSTASKLVSLAAPLW